MGKSLLHQVSSGDLLHLYEVLTVCLLEECEDPLNVLGGACPGWDLLGYTQLRLPNELGVEFGLVTAFFLDKATKMIIESLILTDFP